MNFMNTATIPAPPDYTSWTLEQLLAAQGAYEGYLGVAAYPPDLNGAPWRCDAVMYSQWLEALEAEIAKR